MTVRFRALDHDFAVEGSERERLRAILAPLRIADGPAPATTIALDTEAGRWVVRRSGDELARFRHEEKAITSVLATITRAAISSRPDALVLHAAAVVLHDTTVVLSGRSGAGKSTLTSALMAQGATYLTDEAVVIGADGGIADWLPRPIGLDVTSVTLLGGTPPRRRGPAPQRLATEEQWVGDPPGRSLIMLLGEFDGSLRFGDLTRSELVAQLIGESFEPGRRNAEGLRRLEMFTRSARWATLDGGTPAERADAIARLLRRTWN